MNANAVTQDNRNPWLGAAMALIEADFQRSADTHLIALSLPNFESCGIDLYLKDESTHPTGSLKHRLTRPFFLYPLCNGITHEASTLIEVRSGSTAVSEAHFSRLPGLPFIAVMPRSTSPAKVAQISFYRGSCHWMAVHRRCIELPGRWRRTPAATAWISSPAPSAPQTGAARTTLPKASSTRWHASATQLRAGLWWAPARVAPAPP